MIDFIYSDFFQAVALVVVTGLITRLMTAKGRLLWSISHQHHYRMPRLGEDGSFPVVTQQIWVQNFGRGALKNVSILLNYRPQHYEIWPPREFSEKVLPDGRLAIATENLAGQEVMTISIIDTINEIPHVLNVRSDRGLGREVLMMPTIKFPNWLLFLLWSFIVVGIGLTLYHTINYFI